MPCLLLMYLRHGEEGIEFEERGDEKKDVDFEAEEPLDITEGEDWMHSPNRILHHFNAM